MKGIRAVMPEPYSCIVEEYDVGSPAAGQVLVKTEASGVSPGTELAVYTGIHQWLKDPTNMWAKFPFKPGYSAVGHVLEVGKDVTRFKAGDRVVWPGRHESLALVNTVGDEADIWPINNDVAAGPAALLSLSRFPLTALVRSSTLLGQAVVVLGLGSIGQIATRLFSAAGAFPVIGVDPVAGRRSHATTTYGVHAVDPNEGDTLESVRDILDGGRPDIVVDATGVPAALQDALKLVADGGQVVLVGSPRGIAQQFDTYWDLHGRSVSIVGAHGSAIGIHPRDKFPFTRRRGIPLLIHLAESGRIKYDDLITHTTSLADLNQTYRGLLEQREDFLGAVVMF